MSQCEQSVNVSSGIPWVQVAACSEVQASAVKALASLAPTTKPAQRSDSLVGVSRPVERDQKKTRACELVHHKRCSKWPPLASMNEPTARLWIES